LGISEDITERKRAEKEREQMQAQLIQAQKLESIGVLASGVAHEINNPIMGVMGYAQLIHDRWGAGDADLLEYATEIGKESERVATIVKNLLSFARQNEDSHGSPERLRDIVEATLSLIRAVLRHDQVTLEVDVPPGLPQIRCRSQQIQQVVMNLVTNARDALNVRYPGRDAKKKIIISAREVTRNGKQRAETASSRPSTPDPRPSTPDPRPAISA
jgi:signal transduction histidine kinase